MFVFTQMRWLACIGATLLGLALSSLCYAQTYPPVSLTPTVPAGKTSQIGFFFAINPDCSSRGEIDSRIITAPQNGSVVIQPGADFPRDAKGRYEACATKLVLGVLIMYTPKEGFTGKDQFDIEFIGPRGGDFTWKYYLNVK